MSIPCLTQFPNRVSRDFGFLVCVSRFRGNFFVITRPCIGLSAYRLLSQHVVATALVSNFHRVLLRDRWSARQASSGDSDPSPGLPATSPLSSQPPSSPTPSFILRSSSPSLMPPKSSKSKAAPVPTPQVAVDVWVYLRSDECRALIQAFDIDWCNDQRNHKKIVNIVRGAVPQLLKHVDTMASDPGTDAFLYHARKVARFAFKLNRTIPLVSQVIERLPKTKPSDEDDDEEEEDDDDAPAQTSFWFKGHDRRLIPTKTRSSRTNVLKSALATPLLRTRLSPSPSKNLLRLKSGPVRSALRSTSSTIVKKEPAPKKPKKTTSPKKSAPPKEKTESLPVTTPKTTRDKQSANATASSSKIIEIDDAPDNPNKFSLSDRKRKHIKPPVPDATATATMIVPTVKVEQASINPDDAVAPYICSNCAVSGIGETCDFKGVRNSCTNCRLAHRKACTYTATEFANNVARERLAPFIEMGTSHMNHLLDHMISTRRMTDFHTMLGQVFLDDYLRTTEELAFLMMHGISEFYEESHAPLSLEGEPSTTGYPDDDRSRYRAHSPPTSNIHDDLLTALDVDAEEYAKGRPRARTSSPPARTQALEPRPFTFTQLTDEIRAAYATQQGSASTDREGPPRQRTRPSTSAMPPPAGKPSHRSGDPAVSRQLPRMQPQSRRAQGLPPLNLSVGPAASSVASTSASLSAPTGPTPQQILGTTAESGHVSSSVSPALLASAYSTHPQFEFDPSGGIDPMQTQHGYSDTPPSPSRESPPPRGKPLFLDQSSSDDDDVEVVDSSPAIETMDTGEIDAGWCGAPLVFLGVAHGLYSSICT
ncbi:hypothetical protein C8J57DRAFT_1255452 [Mycena rebaudengoi]|nr:hypothetical protein C8J57DRAFT_1255452 [Mycena rebaudengoi]